MSTSNTSWPWFCSLVGLSSTIVLERYSNEQRGGAATQELGGAAGYRSGEDERICLGPEALKCWSLVCGKFGLTFGNLHGNMIQNSQRGWGSNIFKLFYPT